MRIVLARIVFGHMIRLVLLTAVVSCGSDSDPKTDDTSVKSTLLMRSGFENGVALPVADNTDNPTQTLNGADFPNFDWQKPLFGDAASETVDVLCVTGRGLTMAPQNYCLTNLTSVTGRSDRSTQVLAMSNISESPHTGVQQIIFRRIGMTREPVSYQRMWIKFDEQTLQRARRVGAQNFYQIFWEMKAEPDYRIRLQLQYDESSDALFWQAQGDRLRNSRALWSGQLQTVRVQLADASSAAGWHKVEIWLDRPGGRFRAAIDSVDVVSRTGNLIGASGNIVSQLMMAIVYSDVAPLATMFVDDLEIHDMPPPDAWGSSEQ